MRIFFYYYSLSIACISLKGRKGSYESNKAEGKNETLGYG